MLRRLLAFLSIVSLLLCVATSVLWVRSYWVGYWAQSIHRDVVQGRAVDEQWSFLSASGDLRYSQSSGWSDDTLAVRLYAVNRGTRQQSFSISAPKLDSFSTTLLGKSTTTLLGWYYHEERVELAGNLKRTSVGRTMAVPYWALFVFTSLAPAAFLVRTMRTRRRSSIGLCPSCGYDLRASPERCPECGAEKKPLPDIL